MSTRTLAGLCLTLSLACAAAALADDFKVIPGGGAPYRPVYDKEKIERVMLLLKDLDARIQKGFETNPGLRNQMKKDLSRINEMKPGKERDNAVASYQATYGKEYRAVLKAAGVDLGITARDLEKIHNSADTSGAAPPFLVTASVVDDLYIVAEARPEERNGSAPSGNDPSLNQPPTQPSTPQPAPGGDIASKQQALSDDGTLEASDYAHITDRDCALVAFGENYLEPTRIKSETTSAIAGGCTVWITRSATVQHSGARAATLSTSAELEATGSAAGVGGSAGCWSQATAGNGINAESAYVMVLAPVLFVATKTQTRSANFQLPLPAGAPSSATIRYSTYAFSVAGLTSGAGCSGEVKRIAGRIQ